MNTKEGQEIFDLKPLTKEEVVWLEEHFIDFAREQYLVRWDDMKEALKIAQCQKELQRQDKCGNEIGRKNRVTQGKMVKIRERVPKIGRRRADRAQVTLP